MPPLRLSSVFRNSGYVCTSCLSKLRRSGPSRQLRSFASYSRLNDIDERDLGEGDSEEQAAKILKSLESFMGGVGNTDDLTQQLAQSKFPNSRRNTAQKKRQSLQSQEVSEDTPAVVRHYVQQDDGRIVQVTPEQEEEELNKAIRATKALGRRLDEAAKGQLKIQDEEQKTLTEQLSLDTKFRQELETATLAVEKVAIPADAFDKAREVHNLNEAIIAVVLSKTQKASSDEDDRLLWKRYFTTRNVLASNWSSVPQDFWDLLWQIVSKQSEDNAIYMGRFLTVAKDMESAGAVLDENKILTLIEAKFTTGSTADALKAWEENRYSLTWQPRIESQYWALGARMLAHSNQPGKAVEAAGRHLEILPERQDPTIILPIIAAWLSSDEPKGVQMAWAFYLRLRLLMDSRLSMKIYSACIGIFMTAHRSDLAVAVFSDMMLTNRPERPALDSASRYVSIQGIRDLNSLKTMSLIERETAWEATKPPIAHPSIFRNKFFYHSLIKKFLGDQQVDWAIDVATLMNRRGIAADAKVWNGIIGAWLRKGKSKGVDRAESFAWTMINERLLFVQARQRMTKNIEGGGIVRRHESKNKLDFIQLNAPVCGVRASLETFSVLAELYYRRQKPEMLKVLVDMLRPADITPTADFMNPLLNSGYTEKRFRWVWTFYQKMLEINNVKPNWETFEALWRCEKYVSNPKKKVRGQPFPSCRTLFLEMTKWKSPNSKDYLPSHEMPRTLYHRILTSFGLADDQIGTGIALRAMQIYFGTVPDNETVRSIILQLARAGFDTGEDGFRRPRLNLSDKATKQRVVMVTKLLAQFQKERQKLLEQQGKTFESLSAADRGEHLILLLCDLLRFTVQQRSKLRLPKKEGYEEVSDVDPLVFKELAQTAAVEMGIPQDVDPPWAWPDLESQESLSVE